MALTTARTDANRSAVLAHLGAHGATSRADLARALQLSPALITKLTRELISEGLVHELEHQASSGGRPAQLLGLSANSLGAVGIKVAPDHLTFVEVGIDGALQRTATEPFDASDRLALHSLTTLTKRFVETATHQTLLGIGVGIPGYVLEQSEDVVDSTQLRWSQVPLGSALRAATGLPVLIDNNVNALALTEMLFGVGRGKENLLVVTIGTGIGGAIIAGGAILRGASGNAGEIGHIPVVEDGPVCQCGARGCLESVVGQSAILAKAREEGIVGQDADLSALRRAAAERDPRALDLFAFAGRTLGRTIAGVVNTLDPEVIVIQGEGAESWPHWSEGFELALNANLIPRKRGIPIVAEGWQDDRWAQGAASLVLSTPFDVDGVSGEQGRLVRERLIDAAGDAT